MTLLQNNQTNKSINDTFTETLLRNYNLVVSVKNNNITHVGIQPSTPKNTTPPQDKKPVQKS
jgi:hypothetical protein